MSINNPTAKAPRAALVCEIGNDWLKVIRAEQGRNGVSVSDAHMLHLDPLQSISADTLADVLESMGASDYPLYSCLPRQAVTFRALSLPSIERSEVADMIDLQAGKLTPYSKEEIAYDYVYGGAGGKGYTRVMLAISQRSILRSRYSLLEDAGAQVSQMSISTEGILNWYKGTHRVGKRGDGVLIVDVDSGFTDMVVVESHRLAFSRSVLIGATRLYAEADVASERLAREVANSLSALSAEAPDVRVSSVIITGAGAAVPGLVEVLSTQLGLPVSSEDALEAAGSLPKQPDLRSDAYRQASLTAIIGMSLAPQSLEFDLVPDSVRMRRELMQKARGLSKFGVLLMALMMLLSSYGISKVLLRKAELQRLKPVVEVAEGRADRLMNRMKMVTLVHERVKVDRSVVMVVKDIHERVPNLADIDFSAFSFDAESANVKLAGTGRTTRDIRALVKALELSPLLESVQEGQTKLNKKTGRYDFTLKCTLEEAADAG